MKTGSFPTGSLGHPRARQAAAFLGTGVLNPLGGQARRAAAATPCATQSVSPTPR